MFELMEKKIITLLRFTVLLNRLYDKGSSLVHISKLGHLVCARLAAASPERQINGRLDLRGQR